MYNEQERQFINELSVLFTKYDVAVRGGTCYDQEESPCGDYYWIGSKDGSVKIHIPIESLTED